MYVRRQFEFIRKNEMKQNFSLKELDEESVYSSDGKIGIKYFNKHFSLYQNNE